MLMRLENTRDYFDEITKKAYRQFMDGEVTFLVVYSMANGLYHIAEWICLHDLSRVQAKFGAQIDTAPTLWRQVVEKRIVDAGFIRDLNNAAKHAKLRFDPLKPKKGDPSTGMHHAANTFISIAGYGTGGFGRGPYGKGATEVKMDEGSREVSLEPIATQVFQFWETLVDEFYPKPALTISSIGPNTNS
ncbi:MAG: hypothetical protein AB7S92_10950 [Parvibaculaceae bacterium]